ncbi:MAG: hypothetical protein PHH08_02735 [Candidatus ainarchaeum sp.]|nr:hypothetical protein [Candidatus ainarchaeum sp.]
MKSTRFSARAQVSLEFLLVLLGFSAVFAALLPFYSGAYSAGLFALDAFNAKQFAGSVESSVSELKALGNGSGRILVAEPHSKWKIFSEKDSLFVVLEDKKTGKTREFEVLFPNSIGFGALEFDSKKTFVVEKTGGNILFENTD